MIGHQRKIERRHLIYYLRVFDITTNKNIGHIADITENGLMLISEHKIKAGKEFKLRLKLTDEIFGINELDFEAESLWTKQDINSKFFDTGFKFLNISESNRMIINNLIRNYGFEH